MRLHNACLALGSLIRDIQGFDPVYKTYGEAVPKFESSWDDKLLSLIYTRFGGHFVPQETRADSNSKGSLKGKFMAALENRCCRRNYQQTVDTLEKILDDALPQYGTEQIATLAARSLETSVWGHEFVPMLQNAGIVFSKPERFDDFIKKAQEIESQNRKEQGFRP